MLILSKTLLNRPIMSLRNGAQIGMALAPVINPNNLKIEGFYSQDSFEKEVKILVTTDIRDIIEQGFVVNDHEALTPMEDLVRLKEIIDLNFELMGKPVVTASKERLGKVNDFAADKESLYIQKLYVGQSLLKTLSGGQLSVDRNNIVEITNRKIIINDLLKPQKAGMAVPATPSI